MSNKKLSAVSGYLLTIDRKQAKNGQLPKIDCFISWTDGTDMDSKLVISTTENFVLFLMSKFNNDMLNLKHGE